MVTDARLQWKIKRKTRVLLLRTAFCRDASLHITEAWDKYSAEFIIIYLIKLTSFDIAFIVLYGDEASLLLFDILLLVVRCFRKR